MEPSWTRSAPGWTVWRPGSGPDQERRRHRQNHGPSSRPNSLHAVATTRRGSRGPGRHLSRRRLSSQQQSSRPGPEHRTRLPHTHNDPAALRLDPRRHRHLPGGAAAPVPGVLLLQGPPPTARRGPRRLATDHPGRNPPGRNPPGRNHPHLSHQHLSRRHLSHPFPGRPAPGPPPRPLPGRRARLTATRS